MAAVDIWPMFMIPQFITLQFITPQIPEHMLNNLDTTSYNKDSKAMF